jgi:hypothetical protein
LNSKLHVVSPFPGGRGLTIDTLSGVCYSQKICLSNPQSLSFSSFVVPKLLTSTGWLPHLVGKGTQGPKQGYAAPSHALAGRVCWCVTQGVVLLPRPLAGVLPPARVCLNEPLRSKGTTMALGTITVPGQLGLVDGGVYGPQWAGAQLVLRTDDLAVQPLTEWSELVEASFDGYQRHLIQWSAAAWDSLAAAAYVDDTVKGVWRGPGDGSGQTVVSWAIIQPGSYASGSGAAGSVVLLAGGLLDNPAALVQLYDQLTINVEVSLQGSAATQQVG